MYCNQDFFLREEKTVRETWAKDIIDNKYPDIDFYSYTASNNGQSYIDVDNKIIYINCDDSLTGTFEKTSKCFQLLISNNILEKYDFIFRTNTSTYINISLLNAFLHSDKIDKYTIYGGDIYCAQSCCGPYNYSYYAVGNSMLIPKQYLQLINKEILNEYFEKYYNVIPKRDCCKKIDDNAIGFIINCYLEYVKHIYHKMVYKIFGNNNVIENANLFISTPIRIYNGNREQEFILYNKLIQNYNYSTDLALVNHFIKNTNNYYKIVTF